MSLRGNLVDFPVAEVLQLLAVQEKTGVLRLFGEKERIALVFEKGVIISTWDRGVTSADPLKAFIMERRILPEHMAHKAIRLEARAEYPFVEILLREGMITPVETARLVRDLVHEVVSELLTWRKGRFDFAPESEVIPYGPGCGVKVESVLLEAVRRMDESARLEPKRVFPGIPANLGKVTLNQPISFSGRSVALHLIILALMPAAAFLLSLLFTPSPRVTASPLLGDRVATYNSEREIRNVRIVLEMYRVVNDRYPSSLNQLVSEELLSLDRLSELYNHAIRYRPLENGKRYILFSESYKPLASLMTGAETAPSLEWDLPGRFAARRLVPDRSPTLEIEPRVYLTEPEMVVEPRDGEDDHQESAETGKADHHEKNEDQAAPLVAQ